MRFIKGDTDIGLISTNNHQGNFRGLNCSDVITRPLVIYHVWPHALLGSIIARIVLFLIITIPKKKERKREMKNPIKRTTHTAISMPHESYYVNINTTASDDGQYDITDFNNKMIYLRIRSSLFKKVDPYNLFVFFSSIL